MDEDFMEINLKLWKKSIQYSQNEDLKNVYNKT